jgi:hypothetical protein
MDKGSVGLMTGKQALEGVELNRIRSTQLNPASLTERKHTFGESLLPSHCGRRNRAYTKEDLERTKI